MLPTLSQQLDELLARLPKRTRVTLLLLCVERWAGLYGEFSEATGYGEPSALRRFLDLLWDGATLSADPHQLLSLFPHGEDYQMPQTNVLHCVGSITFAAMQHAHDDFDEHNSFGAAWVELLSIGPALDGALSDPQGVLHDLAVTHSPGFVRESRALYEDYLQLTNATDKRFQAVAAARREAANARGGTFSILGESLGTWSV